MEYKFRDSEEVDTPKPHKDSALGQFTDRLRKAGAYAFEDFRERELKLMLRWAEYRELTNLMRMKDNAGSAQSVAFFAGRQSVLEEISTAVVAIIDDRAAAKKGDSDERQE